MATAQDIYSTEGQSQYDSLTSQGDRVSDGGKIGSNVRHFRVTRVIGTTATDATSDVLSVIRLPKGARLIPDSLRVYADNPGTAYNIATVGDNADADRYSATGLNISAGGYFAFTPAVTAPVNDYKVMDDAADDGEIIATLGTVTSPTAGADITFTGSYSVQN